MRNRLAKESYKLTVLSTFDPCLVNIWMDYFESRIIRVLINPIEIFAVFRTILLTLRNIISTTAILGRKFYLEIKNIYQP